MLKKVNRLRKHYQYNYVYRQSVRYSGKAMTIYVSPSKTKNIKIGFAVTKKVGHAVVRNLIRRRLREVVFKSIPSLKQNYNLILSAKDGIENYTFAELDAEFQKLVSKADLFNEKNF